MTSKQKLINHFVALCFFGFLVSISINAQTTQNKCVNSRCSVSLFNTVTDESKNIGEFVAYLNVAKTIKTFRIPNSKSFVTVAISYEETANNVILSLVIGKKAFQGNLDELKNGNSFVISSASLPSKSFERSEISSIIVEKKQPVLITFECSVEEIPKPK